MVEPLSPFQVERKITGLIDAIETALVELGRAEDDYAEALYAYEHRRLGAFAAARLDRMAVEAAKEQAKLEALPEYHAHVITEARVKTLRVKVGALRDELSGAQTLARMTADQAGLGVYGR